MIPGLRLELIPESDFQHFSEIDDSNSNSIKNLYWNRFRVLESIPKSDIYHDYNSDSDSSKKRNHNTSTSDQGYKNKSLGLWHNVQRTKKDPLRP